MNKAEKRRYHREWYRVHGDALRARQRKRYRKDPAYRERAQDASRERYRKVAQASAPGVVAVTPRVMKKTGRSAGSAPREFTLEGRRKTLYPIGWLAARLGVSVQTMKLWEKRGIVPLATYLVHGRRWYDARYVYAVCTRTRPRSLLDWSEEIRRRYDAAGGRNATK